MPASRFQRHLAFPVLGSGFLAGNGLGQIVLFDTVNSTPNGSITVAANQMVAESFSTSARTGEITQVILAFAGSGSPTGNYTVSLFNDVTGKPGSRLYTIDTGTVASTVSNPQHIYSGLSLGVDPSTRYWITLETSGSSYSAITHAPPNVPEGISTSADNGVNWSTADTTRLLFMGVAAVPEPTFEAAAVGGALLGLAAWRCGAVRRWSATMSGKR